MNMNTLKAFVALFLTATVAHAQVTFAPSTLTLYPSATATAAVTFPAGEIQSPPLITGASLTASLAGTTLTVTSLAGATGTSYVQLVSTNTLSGGPVSTSTLPVTFRDRPAIGTSSADPHGAHFHSDPVEQGHVLVSTNGSVTALSATSGNTALYTVSLSGTNVTITPVANASGTANLTVIGTDSVLGGAVTNLVPITVRPVTLITAVTPNPLTFNEDTSGSVTFRVDTCYPFTAANCTYTFTEPYAPYYAIIASNTTTYAVSGGTTNMTTTFWPMPDAYGTVTARLDVVVGDLPYTKSTNIVINVLPIPDPPKIANLPDEIILSSKDPWTNAFRSAVITDPDDFPPPPPPPPAATNKEILSVSVVNTNQAVVFNNTQAWQVETPPPMAYTTVQTAWLTNLTLRAKNGLFGIINTTNTYDVVITATGADGLASTNTVPVKIWFQNTPPEFDIRLNGVTSVEEGAMLKPFTLLSITDPDPGQETFTLAARLAPDSLQYGYINVTTNYLVIGNGNATTLNTALINGLEFTAYEGVMTNATETLSFIFELSDGYDTTVHTNTLTLVQLMRSPVINLGNGAPTSFLITSDTTAPTAPFPLISVTDPDEGGNQFVRAQVTVSPAYLTLDNTAGTADLQHPLDLSTLLRGITFLPDLSPGSPLADVPIGQTVNATISIVAFDKTGLSSAPARTVTISIERRNAAPVITVPADQPVLFNPGNVIRPFADIGLWNDDTDPVKFTFVMDDPGKGVFGNTSGLTVSGNGYTITDAIPAILAIVTNVTFTLNAAYPFPPDDPGGTTFTLSAQDTLLANTSAKLVILVQAPPRNWLVTNPIDDGEPGSLTHALMNFGNADVITFALPEYPATLRLTNATEITAAKALTLKGPGADLLTLSGDTNGNGKPDRRFLTVAAPVTLEGLTIADCTGDFGGAISVVDNGHLTLRQVTFRNCIATEAGGAIDVDHGQLTVDASLFLDNATTANALYGGGAISLFTDTLITFRNTVFARNRQGCINGMGGGAINAEFPGDTPWFLDIDVAHCTFTDNQDIAFDLDVQATSIFANSGSALYLVNNVFNDDPATRTLNTANAAEIWSFGGNVCDDNATVFLNQMGYPIKTLLDHSTDVLEFDTLFDPAFAPLNLDPYHVHAEVPTDLAGRIRTTVQTLPGALDPTAAAFPVVTEIQLAQAPGACDAFIEIYAPYGEKGPVNLNGMTLLVNGTPVHTFGSGTIANPATSLLFTAGDDASGIPATYTFPPGHGVVIAFPAAAGPAVFQEPPTPPLAPDNPTPIVRASIVSNALDFAHLLSDTSRGSIAIVSPNNTELPIVRHTFLTAYNDPDSPGGTNLLAIGTQSVATLPQACGYAFVPHTWENPSRIESPGAEGNGTPFGGDFPPPIARPDHVTATEDDATRINVLANDTDPVGEPLWIDGFDLLSANYSVPVSYDPLTGCLTYDPTAISAIQELPAGREVIDTFTYILWAGRKVPITNAVLTGVSPPYEVTCTTAAEHGFAVDDVIWITTNRLIVTGTPDPFVFQFMTDDPDFLTANAEALTTGDACTRNPATTSTATVTVTLQGLNDNPVGVDDLLHAIPSAQLTERQAIRLLAHLDLADSAVFNEYPQTPVPNVGLLANDTDVDEGDTPDTFRITGVLSDTDVHLLTAIAPAAGGADTLITSPGHGLASGATVTIVGVENPARLNGIHTATVVDDDTFTIPVEPGIIRFTRAAWVPSTTALTATTPLGAAVSLITRANELEDNIVYNAEVSAELRKLAQGEYVVDGFWYILTDQHNTPGFAYVSLTVNGVNDDPVVNDNPPALDDLTDTFGGDDTLDTLTNRITVLTILVPPESGRTGYADLIVADNALADLTTPDLLLLNDFYSTDERTPLLIASPELLARATDVDTNDVLSIVGPAPASRLGAAVSVTPGTVTYDPTPSATLQALGIGETAFDLFTVNVSDGIASVPMRVIVLVRGVNNTPTAHPVYVYNPDALPTVTFTPDVTDIDVNDTHMLVTPASTTIAVPSPLLPTNAIPYTVTDHSLFLALDDTFRVPLNAPVTTLDVLANDINVHGTGLTLQSVTPSLRGGTVAVNATGSALLYLPPAGFAGTDVFTYAVTNALGIARRANVRVHVILNEYNGPLHACDDEYALALGMSLDMPVLDNDVLLPNSPAGITIDPTYHTDWPAGLTLNGNMFHYQSALTDPALITFTYRILGGGGATSVAGVRIKIIERFTGIQPDWFTAAPGAAPLTLDLLANDIIYGDSNEGMTITALGTLGTAGTVAIAPDHRTVTYAAPAGFIGVDTFTYSAVDRYGAQGTTNVTVIVGVPLATRDAATVATNTVDTLLDVLANDTVLPYATPTSLTLTDVFLRPGETPNGTATLADNKVCFTASSTLNAEAVWLYTFTAPGASAVITGEVSIVTANTGTLYASADNFTVRMNADTVPLDVLANDASYRAVYFPLTIQSFQTITQQGGTVTQDGDLLSYTPPTGFWGIDTFTYVAFDGFATASGLVTLYVTRGDLIANDDAFIVGYEWDPVEVAAKAYALPVLVNDAVFPGGTVAISVTPNFGIGADAPSMGGTVSVSPDGKAVLYRPPAYPGGYPGNEYAETFTYETEDAYGRKQSAHVTVTVRLRISAIEIETQDDAFNVERDSVNNILPITANDLVEPKTPLPPSGIHVEATAAYGIISVSGANLIYTPPAGFVGVDTATYTLTDGIGGSGTATVTIFVGALPTATDTFSVLRGSTNYLDVIANDAFTQPYLASYSNALVSVYGATAGGDVALAGTQVRYIPDPAYPGPYPYTEEFTYLLSDDTGRITLGTVTATVYDLDDSLASSIVYVINPNLVIPGSPRDLWNKFYFGNDYASNPDASGSADPLGDGVSNDTKYVFGGDPTVFDPTVGHIRIALLPDGTADITYTRRANDPALVFTLWACDDLAVGAWYEVSFDVFSFIAHPTDTELIIATHNVPVPASPLHRFFKISVDF